jgi:hypothetical protein
MFLLYHVVLYAADGLTSAKNENFGVQRKKTLLRRPQEIFLQRKKC